MTSENFKYQAHEPMSNLKITKIINFVWYDIWISQLHYKIFMLEKLSCLLVWNT